MRGTKRLQRFGCVLCVGLLVVLSGNTCMMQKVSASYSNRNVLSTFAEVSGKQMADTKEFVIALDPGHGGEEHGAEYYGIQEKDVNLKVAQMVKQRLEQYDHISVFLTRTEDEAVGLTQRADRAKAAGADLFVSLHMNASVSHQSKGASVYISTGTKYLDTLRDLADLFLGEFETLGLGNAGTFARVTQLGGKRADGSFEDYYGVLRHAYDDGIPAVIVEHCYMDHVTDCTFVESEDGLSKLADADAKAIAAYYGKEQETHATVYGGTTKAVEADYYEAPQITGIRLEFYNGKTPGVARYQVDIKDGIGVSSIYLVYRNAKGDSVTVPLMIKPGMTDGSYTVNAYIPENLEMGSYTLSYIGAYNLAGYDAGYNHVGTVMTGYGKCDWLNSFDYQNQADIIVEQEGMLSIAHVKKLEQNLGMKLHQSSFRILSAPY